MKKVSNVVVPNTMLCPSCGHNNLHHYAVDVYERDEDWAECIHTNIQNGITLVAVDGGAGNPSDRRNGLVIKFWCEGCHEISELSIVQHKGETHYDFQSTGEQYNVENNQYASFNLTVARQHRALSKCNDVFEDNLQKTIEKMTNEKPPTLKKMLGQSQLQQMLSRVKNKE